jgi:ubiquitin-protein ligase
MSAIFTKRLTKELHSLQSNPPAGLRVETADDNLKQ